MVLSRKKEMGRLGTEAVISDTGSGHKLCERASRRTQGSDKDCRIRS